MGLLNVPTELENNFSRLERSITRSDLVKPIVELGSFDFGLFGGMKNTGTKRI